MTELPVQIRVRLRRLARRVAAGLFLEIWPRWASVAVAAAALTVLVCRVAVPAAAGALPWLWLVPLVVAIPAAAAVRRRMLDETEIAALGDSLAGGSGTLLAVVETQDLAWLDSPLLQRAGAFPLPRIQAGRRLAPLAATLAGFAIAMALPQREARASNAAVAHEMVKDLGVAVAELKRQNVVSAEEEKTLQDEIDRIRREAEKKVDAGSWEAADALREKLAADVAEKQQALEWARASLARYADAAADSANGGTAGTEAQAAEVSKALEKLARSGLLDGAPEQLKQVLKGGKLPTDAASLRELSTAFSKYLGERNGQFRELSKLAKDFGRFNPADFPTDEGDGTPGGLQPGSGGVDRGRGDAELTWGKESAPLDRFAAKPLPPGAPRSPDDWAPLTELPGAPQVAPQGSAAAAARQYDATPGQAAWRRTLVPRHQSAVKKYFAK